MARHAWAGTVIGLASVASAQNAVQWNVADGGNGHWYEMMDMGQISWIDAQSFAESIGGHLATLTSAEECQFVGDLFPSDRATAIGGYQDRGSPDYEEPAGGWRWVTGEPWDYTGWKSDEPSNHGDVEDFLFMANTNLYACAWGDGGDLCEPCQPILLAIEWSADCNNDGIVDYGQILDGTFEDLDGNGVPDCCENGGDCCRADLTGDDQINTLDFLLYLGAWSQRDPLADWDGNGTVNTLDFLDYLNAWVAGC